VGHDGQQIGIKPCPKPFAIARELDLDLVEVAPDANPPVCKVLDYGKFKYEEAQRAKESRRKSSSISIKEMKYRPKIGQGDFDTKTPRSPSSSGTRSRCDHVPGRRCPRARHEDPRTGR
jgi:translation initiation factor IF-3